MKKFIFLFAILFSITSFSQRYSQNKIRPFRVDVKAGLPGIVGFNAEYLTTGLNNRLALFGNFSGFTSDVHIEGVDETLNYFEIGSNVYLRDNGNGLYGSLSYGNLNIEATYFDVPDDEGDNVAEASGEFKANTINLKVGIKLGGLIYFRGEVGYGFGSIPSEVEVNSNVNQVKDTFLIERPEFPGMSDSGFVIANIGVGVAF